MFQKKIQDNNSKLNGRNNNKYPLIAQEKNPNGLPITYFWYHGITSNIFHHRKYCKSPKEGHKLNETLPKSDERMH